MEFFVFGTRELLVEISFDVGRRHGRRCRFYWNRRRRRSLQRSLWLQCRLSHLPGLLRRNFRWNRRLSRRRRRWSLRLSLRLVSGLTRRSRCRRYFLRRTLSLGIRLLRWRRSRRRRSSLRLR